MQAQLQESCAHNTSCICMHYHDNQLMSEVNPIKSYSPWAAHLLMPEEIIKSGLLQPTEIAAELEFLFVVTENMSLEDSFVHKTIAVGADLVSNWRHSHWLIQVILNRNFFLHWISLTIRLGCRRARGSGGTSGGSLFVKRGIWGGVLRRSCSKRCWWSRRTHCTASSSPCARRGRWNQRSGSQRCGSQRGGRRTEASSPHRGRGWRKEVGLAGGGRILQAEHVAESQGYSCLEECLE